jgi:hypothetical protein
MDGIVAYFALDSGDASEVRKFSEEAVDRLVAPNGLYAGNQRAGDLGRYRHRRDPVQ